MVSAGFVGAIGTTVTWNIDKGYEQGFLRRCDRSIWKARRVPLSVNDVEDSSLVRRGTWMERANRVITCQQAKKILFGVWGLRVKRVIRVKGYLIRRRSYLII